MKNAIIAVLGAYIFYGFCVVRHFIIPIVAFLLFWVMVEAIDEEIKDYVRRVRRGKRLNKIIENAKGVKHG